MRLRTTITAAVVLAGVVALALTAGYFVLRSIDLNSYRTEIIARVNAATGRDLTITGDLRIGLHNGLIIRVDDLALSNAAWGTRPQMLSLNRAEARVALLPLLRGDIQIRQITLQGADLLLETQAAGAPNWEFDTPADAGASPVDMRSIVIESGRVTWRTAGTPHSNEVLLTDLALAAALDGDRLRLQAAGRIDDQLIELSGHLPSPLARTLEQSLNVDLHLAALGAEIDATGSLQRAPWGLSPELTLQARRLDIARLARLAGYALPRLPVLDAAFDLSRDSEAWHVANLTARAGTSDLAGDIRLASARDRQRVSASFTSHRIDLAELFAEPPVTSGSAPAGEPATDPPGSHRFGALHALDGTLEWRAERLTGPRVDLQDVQLQGRLLAGRLTLGPLQAQVAGGGRAGGTLQLDGAAAQPAWTLGLRLRHVPAAALLGPQQASLVEAPLDLDLELEARGTTQRQIRGGLSGRARLLVNKGRARLRTIDTLVGGLSTLTGQLSEQGSADAQLNCMVADFVVERGVAEANILLIDSAVSTVRGDGRIDFGSERLDLTFTPQPKTPTLSVAVPVHVRGPLRAPQFTADRSRSIMKLIGVASLFIYPPAALAALGELGDSDNACIGLVHGGSRARASDSALDRIRESASDAVDSIGRGLERLFGR